MTFIKLEKGKDDLLISGYSNESTQYMNVPVVINCLINQHVPFKQCKSCENILWIEDVKEIECDDEKCTVYGSSKGYSCNACIKKGWKCSIHCNKSVCVTCYENDKKISKESNETPRYDSCNICGEQFCGDFPCSRHQGKKINCPQCDKYLGCHWCIDKSRSTGFYECICGDYYCFTCFAKCDACSEIGHRCYSCANALEHNYCENCDEDHRCDDCGEYVTDSDDAHCVECLETIHKGCRYKNVPLCWNCKDQYTECDLCQKLIRYVEQDSIPDHYDEPLCIDCETVMNVHEFQGIDEYNHC